MSDERPKVVGLRGAAVSLENGAQPDVITALENALDEAKRGDIIAIGMVLIRSNLQIGTVSRNPAGHRHLIVAGCHYLMTDIAIAP